MKKSKSVEPGIKNQVSVWLDSYDDIFSDFDPMPYTKRALSDDFIHQVKKLSAGHSRGQTSLELLFPVPKRNMETEKVVAEQLQRHFRLTYEKLLEERRNRHRRAWFFVLSGVLFMVISSYLSFLSSRLYFMHLMKTFSEPAGWFLLWTGLDQFLYFSAKSTSDMAFYKSFRDTEIECGGY